MHCLESPDFLPFWGDPYRIRQVPWSFGRLDYPTIYLDVMPPEWEPGKAGNHFGTLNVTIMPENDAVVIDEICTRYKGPVPSVPQRSRVGCELVRRVLSFAANV